MQTEIASNVVSGRTVSLKTWITLLIDVRFGFLLINCDEVMVSLVLESSMKKLISESKSYGQFSIKSGLVYKIDHNFTEPNLIDQLTLA